MSFENTTYDAAKRASTGGEGEPEDHLLTVGDVARMLQVPVSWVYEHIRERCANRVPGFRLGKYWRFSAQDVTEWIHAQRTNHYRHG